MPIWVNQPNPKCNDQDPKDPCNGPITKQPYERHQTEWTWLCVKHQNIRGMK